MLTLEEIKLKIEKGLPGANALILDPRRDGKHLKAVITYKGFEGKSLLEQHRMVNKTLEEEFKGQLHALAIETREQ